MSGTEAGPSRLPPSTSPGTLSLRVSDAERARDFYVGVLGLEAAEAGGVLELSAPGGGRPLLRLRELPGARPRPRRSTGLFHVALLLPDRPSLARIFLRLSEREWPLQGASDHAVSEALYLADPDGTGIEIYADRPREAWRWEAGQVRMVTDPLDLRGLVAELPPDDAGDGLPTGATVGHIHLQVSDLETAEAFWAGLIGFDVTTRAYPGALFLSAGGYHHHLGLNTWAGRGAPPPPDDAAGLAEVELVVPEAGARERLREAISQARPTESADDGFRVRDPDGVPLLIRG